MSDFWSRLGHKVLGIDRPSALTASGWNKWHNDARSARPVRYWLSNTALDWVEDVVKWPRRRYRSVTNYINNRWITKSHSLTGHPRDLQPGHWHDLDYRMLYCNFNELVNFVEIECAWINVSMDDDAAARHGKPRWWRRRMWRSAEAGVEHLEWAAALRWDETSGVVPGDKLYGQLTGQAIGATEILDLYRWWTVTRPARPEASEVSGWDAAYADSQDGAPWLDDDVPSPARQARRDAAVKLDEIERQYDQEDTDQLVRLMKIRQHLWT